MQLYTTQKSQNVRVTKCKHHITLSTVMSLYILMFTFWNYYILKLLRLETITFSDAMLSDRNLVLCYILSQYHPKVPLPDRSHLAGRYLYGIFTVLESSHNLTIAVISQQNEGCKKFNPQAKLAVNEKGKCACVDGDCS